MQWEKPNPTTLSNLPYTINSTYQSAHSTASICATKNTHGCSWHARIERNLFPTLPRRSLPKIIQNHFINYFYCGQLQTENHHHQKTDWTCWWTLHGLSALKCPGRELLHWWSCHWRNASHKTSCSISGLYNLIFNGNMQTEAKIHGVGEGKKSIMIEVARHMKVKPLSFPSLQIRCISLPPGHLHFSASTLPLEWLLFQGTNFCYS